MLIEARELLEVSDDTGRADPAASLKVFASGEWMCDWAGDDKRTGEDTVVPAMLLDALCFPFALELAAEPSLS